MVPDDAEAVTMGPCEMPGRQPAARPQRHLAHSVLVAAAFVATFVVAAVVTNSGQGSNVDEAHIAPSSSRALKGINMSSTGNPFEGKRYYKNPVNQASYDATIEKSRGKVRRNLKRMRKTPSAYWIDVKAKIQGTGTQSVEGILADASSKKTPEMVVFIWYDLPNRDCHAKASNGEICCKYLPDGRCDYTWQTDCKEGLKEYEETYADPFVKILEKYQDKVPIAIVIEPDSLPNLATNTDDPRCGGAATKEAYMKGISYSVTQITSKAPKVAVYLDAAHGGWLGWEQNLEDFMNMLKSMDMPYSKMRGFATNVANYQPLGTPCPYEPDSGFRNGYCLNGRHQGEACCDDPCGLSTQWNPGNNEHNYAQDLVMAAKAILSMDAHVVIDTGRNGVDDMREDCAHWCNIRGAGAGVRSTSRTAAPEYVDAYYWLKTPGESDGCTEELPEGGTCPRFDADCAGPDSLGSEPDEPRAPEAGRWFEYQVQQLAENAQLRRRR